MAKPESTIVRNFDGTWSGIIPTAEIPDPTGETAHGPQRGGAVLARRGARAAQLEHGAARHRHGLLRVPARPALAAGRSELWRLSREFFVRRGRDRGVGTADGVAGVPAEVASFLAARRAGRVCRGRRAVTGFPRHTFHSRRRHWSCWTLDLKLRVQELEARLAALGAAERHARELAEAERRRADAAVEAARRAWRLSAWPALRGGSDLTP